MIANEIASSRRAFLKGTAVASFVGASKGAWADLAAPAEAPVRRPNVLMICSDQFRADFIGAALENLSTRATNLDAMARRGTMCTQAICHQPLCSPSRASFLNKPICNRDKRVEVRPPPTNSGAFRCISSLSMYRAAARLRESKRHRPPQRSDPARTAPSPDRYNVFRFVQEVAPDLAPFRCNCPRSSPAFRRWVDHRNRVGRAMQGSVP